VPQEPLVLLLVLDYLGTLAFAVSGALKGIRKSMDIFGVTTLAVVTAIGGGTVRDALLDLRVFWLDDQVYVLLAIVAAIAVFLLYRVVQKTETALLYFDAVGLGVFTAIGAMKALQAEAGLVGVVAMACLTGVGGGIIRDLLAGDIPIVLRAEVYASATIAGALGFWSAQRVGAPLELAILVAVVITIALRVASILLKWNLPRHAGALEHPDREDPS